MTYLTADRVCEQISNDAMKINEQIQLMDKYDKNDVPHLFYPGFSISCFALDCSVIVLRGSSSWQRHSRYALHLDSLTRMTVILC